MKILDFKEKLAVTWKKFYDHYMEKHNEEASTDWPLDREEVDWWNDFTEFTYGEEGEDIDYDEIDEEA